MTARVVFESHIQTGHENKNTELDVDAFNRACASISLETDLLTPQVQKIIQQSILEGVTVEETVQRVLQDM